MASLAMGFAGETGCESEFSEVVYWEASDGAFGCMQVATGGREDSRRRVKGVSAYWLHDLSTDLEPRIRTSDFHGNIQVGNIIRNP